MKVLILGAKGMLGQELVRIFSNNHEVIPYDKEELDITDATAMEKALDEIKPELVINSVAINAVDKIEEDAAIFDVAMKVNAVAAGKLASFCHDRDITFVHYSSDYVFPGTSQEGYTEDAPTAPVNKYG